MKNRLLAGFIVILLLAGGLYVWYKEATSPVSKSREQIIFVVKKGEGVRSIADRLKNEGLIRSPLGFFVAVRMARLATKIQAGDFRLSPSMSALEVAEGLTHGTIDSWVTLPEGWRNGEVAMRLFQDLGLPKVDFLTIAKEGYVFPDTYLVPKEASVESVIAIFNKNFTSKVTEDFASEINSSKYTLDQILTLASIVEREARFSEDRPKVASVLLNRLELGMPLQADATLQYIKGYDENTGKWWSPTLSSDKDLDSPYNTYKNVGLPPGPIANPGLSAIKAVLNPAETDYLYYVSEADGTTHFAQIYDEHLQNIQKYLLLDTN